MRGRSEALIDGAARGLAGGMSRRSVLRLGAGIAAASTVPLVSLPEPAEAKIVRRGFCPAQKQGTCPDKMTAVPWTKTAKHPIPSGVPSRFNGCGPEAGIQGGDPVPDKPLGLVDFFPACYNHDCCYGNCGASQAQCDLAFLNTALSICKAKFRMGDPIREIKRGICIDLANTYHGAVAGGGADAFEAAQKVGCLDCKDDDCGGKDLLSDAANCGACGNACKPGQACCNGICTNLDANSEHCGACGNPCPGGQRCVGSVCIGCEKDKIVCAEACCDPATEECVDGKCRIKCESGQTRCEDACCGPNEICEDGGCKRKDHCYDGYEDCGGECCKQGRCIDGKVCGHGCGQQVCVPEADCCSENMFDQQSAKFCCTAEKPYCYYAFSGKGKCLAL